MCVPALLRDARRDTAPTTEAMGEGMDLAGVSAEDVRFGSVFPRVSAEDLVALLLTWDSADDVRARGDVHVLCGSVMLALCTAEDAWVESVLTLVRTVCMTSFAPGWWECCSERELEFLCRCVCVCVRARVCVCVCALR